MGAGGDDVSLPVLERGVSLAVEGGVLHGTVTRPEGEAGGLGVLIVAGSGPVDRDGNVPGMANDCLKLLAHGLAAQGIVCLRTDKRAIGASVWPGLHEGDLRFGDYVRDAVGWAGVLRAEAGVSSVALLGHSEGALVVTLAAQGAPGGRAGASRIVLLAGAGTPAGPIMERQFSEGGLPEVLRGELHRILVALAAGRAVEDVPAAFESLFRDSMQPYLMSWLPIDPAVALSRVQVPVLVVQGTTDIQVGVADARILAASRPGAELALVDGMNHVLRAAPLERGANVAAYRDAGAALHPGLVGVVAGFLGC